MRLRLPLLLLLCLLPDCTGPQPEWLLQTFKPCAQMGERMAPLPLFPDANKKAPQSLR